MVPLEKGMANHFSILALRTPWTVKVKVAQSDSLRPLGLYSPMNSLGQNVCFDLLIWSLIPLPFLSPAWTCGSSRFMYCQSLAWRILSITLLAWRWVQLCSSLNILWHCPFLGLEWKLTFCSPVATAEFSKFAGKLRAAFSQHHLLGFEIAQLEFHHLH